MTGQSVARLSGTGPKTVLILQLGEDPLHEGGAELLVCCKNIAYSPFVMARLDERKGLTICLRRGFSLSQPKNFADGFESSSISSRPTVTCPPGKYCHFSLSSIIGFLPRRASSCQSGTGT